ncbi:MAG: hypothetical protein LH480_03635 [Rubrivivax sp.]|nr:hypothetical protein [Rubrivivax sp.]
MQDRIVIRQGRPDQPEVVALLDTLDRYFASGTGAARLVEGDACVRRAAFGGYPDNGLSVYHGKAL